MLDNALIELKKRKNQITAEIGSLVSQAKRIGTAIKVLSKLSGPVKAKAGKKRRRMPAAAIAKIRAAQKKRWAEWRKKQGK